MDSAQKAFEAKAAQLREISVLRNPGELERLVGEMTEVLENQAGKGGDGCWDGWRCW